MTGKSRAAGRPERMVARVTDEGFPIPRPVHVLWAVLALLFVLGVVNTLLRSDEGRSRKNSSRERSRSHAGKRNVRAERHPIEIATSSAETLRPPSAGVVGWVTDTRQQTVVGATACLDAPSTPCCARESCTRSNQAGEFRLDAVPAAGATLVVSAPGYLTHHQILNPLLIAPPPLKVSLQPGGRRLAGRVVDAFGGHVEGALVLAKTLSSGAPPERTWSNSDGLFELSAPSGELQLTAAAESYSLARQALPWAREGVELVLTPPGAVTGRVVTKRGIAVSGVHVEARAPIRTGGGWSNDVSASDGHFHLDGLPPSTYTLRATSAQWRSEHVSVEIAVGESAEVELVVSPITTVAVELNGMDSPCEWGEAALLGQENFRQALRSSNRVQFSGVPNGDYELFVSCRDYLPLRKSLQMAREPVVRQVALERGLSIEGTVYRANGAPLPSARVHVQRQGEQSVEAHRTLDTTCFTDEGGHFTCHGLNKGGYECTVAVDDYPVSETQACSLVEGNIQGLEIVAFPHGTVHGSVAGNGGELFTVLATDENGVVREARRVPDGFVLSGLPLGQYSMSVGEASSSPSGSRVVNLVHDGQQLDVVLDAQPMMVLEGRVTDNQGCPIPDAWVSARGLARSSSKRLAPVLTDAQGYFSIQRVVPGTYHVHATATFGRAELLVVAAGRIDIELRVREFGALRGSATDANGTAIESFRLSYGPPPGPFMSTAFSTSSWDLPTLSPGKYQVRVRAATGTAFAEETVSPGKATILHLVVASSPAPPSRTRKGL